MIADEMIADVEVEDEDEDEGVAPRRARSNIEKVILEILGVVISLAILPALRLKERLGERHGRMMERAILMAWLAPELLLLEALARLPPDYEQIG